MADDEDGFLSSNEEFSERRALPEFIQVKKDILDYYFGIKRGIMLYSIETSYNNHKVIEGSIIGLYSSLRSKLNPDELKRMTVLEKRMHGKIIEKEYSFIMKDPRETDIFKTATTFLPSLIRYDILVDCFIILQQSLERIGILKIERRAFRDDEVLA